ncbi:MAG: hypothetical protein MZW92_41410 [Comamonadaceae bacterium]|nr:hypothetical protein [Comamonadaceae bacterium]
MMAAGAYGFRCWSARSRGRPSRPDGGDALDHACPSCALDNPDDGRFCTGRGAKPAIPMPPAPAPGAAAPPGPGRPVFATNAGPRSRRTRRFCTACGRTTGPAARGTGIADRRSGRPARVAVGRGLPRRPRRAPGRRRLREGRRSRGARPRPLPAPQEVRADADRPGHGGLRRQGPRPAGRGVLCQGLQQGRLRRRRR